MPDNFLIIPTSNITNGRIDSLANARHATDQNLTVQALTNGQEVTVYRLSDGIAGTPVAPVANPDPVTITLTDVPHPDFPVVVEADLQTVIIPVSGTYTGAVPTDIRARILNAVDGSEYRGLAPVTLTSAAGGNWAGTTTAIPGNGAYLAEVRVGTSGPPQVQTIPFRTCGAVIGFGQSNELLFVTTADATVTPRPDVFVMDRNTGNGFAERYGAPTGGGVTSLLNGLASETGLSWVYISGGLNGVKSRFLDNVNSGGIDNTSILDRLRFDLAKLNRLPHLANYHQGEGDGVSVTIGEPLSFYKDPIDNAFDTILGDFGSTNATDLPVIVSSLCSVGTTGYSGWATVDQYHMDMTASDPRYHWGGSWKDAQRLDNFHCYGSSYTRRGLRILDRAKIILGLQSEIGRFEIDTATRIDATTTRLSFAHGEGSDFNILEIIPQQESFGTNTTLARGFEISDGGAYVTATGTKIDGTTLDLTHAPLGLTGCDLHYLRGDQPDTSGVIVDNSPEAVPLLHTGLTPISVASGTASTGATFAQQAFGVPSAQNTFTATSQLPGANRFLYTVQINRNRTLAFTNGGAAITPLAVIEAPNSDGNGSPEANANKTNRLYVFETDSLDEIGITLSGGGFGNNAFGVTLTEARGTNGAWSIADSVARMPVDRDDSTLTHAPMAPPNGSIVTGIVIGDSVPVDITSYVSANIATYSETFGSTQAVIATALGAGSVTYYEAVLTGNRKRMASVIATINAA